MGAHSIVDITAGTNPQQLVEYAHQVFVAVEGTNQIAVIDTNSNTVSRHIGVAQEPWRLAVVEAAGAASGPAGALLYVYSAYDASMTIVDVATLSPTATFPCGSYGGTQIYPTKMVDTRRGGVYFGDGNGTRILEAGAHGIVGAIDLGLVSYGIAVSGDGSKVYVTHPNDSAISVVDTTAATPSVTRIAVAQYPYEIVLTPDENRLYVSHFISRVAGLFRVIDLTTMLASSVNTHLFPWGLVGDDSRAYAASGAAQCIDVLDTTIIPPRVVETIALDGPPGYLVYGPDHQTLYTSMSAADDVLAVSLGS